MHIIHRGISTCLVWYSNSYIWSVYCVCVFVKRHASNDHIVSMLAVVASSMSDETTIAINAKAPRSKAVQKAAVITKVHHSSMLFVSFWLHSSIYICIYIIYVCVVLHVGFFLFNVKLRLHLN